jgi:hypothetical protein
MKTADEILAALPRRRMTHIGPPLKVDPLWRTHSAGGTSLIGRGGGSTHHWKTTLPPLLEATDNVGGVATEKPQRRRREAR